MSGTEAAEANRRCVGLRLALRRRSSGPSSDQRGRRLVVTLVFYTIAPDRGCHWSSDLLTVQTGEQVQAEVVSELDASREVILDATPNNTRPRRSNHGRAGIRCFGVDDA